MEELEEVGMLSLPDEILLNILETIPLSCIRAIRLTCKRLHQLSYAKEILRKQKFRFSSKSERCTVHKMFDILTELNLSHFNFEFVDVRFDDTIQNFLHSHGASINSLSFKKCRIPFSVLKDIMIYCVNLKELRFSACRPMGNLKELYFVFKNKNAKLNVLKIKNCDQFPTKFIYFVLDFYTDIKTLAFDMQMQINYDEADFRQFVDSKLLMFRRILECNKSIQKLKIVVTELSESQIQQLANSELKLTSLCLIEHKFMSSLKYKDLFSKQNDLQELELQNCEYVDSETIQYSLSHCRKLEHLNITRKPGNNIYFEDIMNAIHNHGHGEHLKSIKLSYPKFVPNEYSGITNLKFSNLYHVDFDLDSSFTKGRNNLKILANCRLTYLRLKSILPEDVRNVWQIVSTSQDTLVTLKLWLIDEVLPSTDYSFFSELNLSKLEVLEICISTKHQEFAKCILNDFNFPAMRELMLYYCDYLTSEDLRTIPTKCILLESISLLVGSDVLEKEAVSELCNNLHLLRNFTLEMCGTISACDKAYNWKASELIKLPTALRRVSIKYTDFYYDNLENIWIQDPK